MCNNAKNVEELDVEQEDNVIDDAIDRIYREELINTIHDIIIQMNYYTKHKIILIRRFGLDGNPPETLSDIGEKLGIKGNTVRIHEQEMLRRFRREAILKILKSFYQFY